VSGPLLSPFDEKFLLFAIFNFFVYIYFKELSLSTTDFENEIIIRQEICGYRQLYCSLSSTIGGNREMG